MTTVTIPLDATPNQTVSVVINNVRWTIKLNTRLGQLFASVENDRDGVIVRNRVCLDRVPIKGHLFFMDLDKNQNPTYTGLNSRFFWSIQMNRKIIKVTITLAGKDEVFTADGKNQMSAEGLRVLYNITYGYGAVMPTAQIRIYGLALDKMMKLFRVQWNTLGALMNMVKIEVGEEGGTLLKEFEGNITFAYPDFSTAPDVALVIESQMAMLENMRMVPVSEYKDEIDIADVVADICQTMGSQLENNGVSIKDKNIHLGGNNIEKLNKLSFDYKFDLYIENNLIAITPKGGCRNIKVPVITPATGLIGYLIPDLRGVQFKCFYDPLLRFGGLCKIRESIIDFCNGDWRIYGLYKSLEANQPNGNWFCEVSATWKDSEDAAISK